MGGFKKDEKKVTAIVLGMVFLLTTATAAVADSLTSSPQDFKQNSHPHMVAGQGMEAKDGLFVQQRIDQATEGNTEKTMLSGWVNREEFVAILEVLDRTEEEKQALLTQYDENKGVQEQISALMTSWKETEDRENRQSNKEEIKTLQAKQQDIFSGEILSKAMELGYVQESTAPAMEERGLQEELANGDGLLIHQRPEQVEQTRAEECTIMRGVLTRDELAVLDDLGQNAEQKEALLEQFDAIKEMQDQLGNGKKAPGKEGTAEQEPSGKEEMKTLQAAQQNFLTDEILAQAVDLEFVEASTFPGDKELIGMPQGGKATN